MFSTHLTRLGTCICLLLLGSCNKINLYGDTFYTVEGKMEDANSIPVSGISLQLLTSKKFAGDTLILSQTKTTGNGNFKIIFPRSNGDYHIVLPTGYKILDSIAKGSLDTNRIGLPASSFVDYHLNVNIVKVAH